jgi:putative permease
VTVKSESVFRNSAKLILFAAGIIILLWLLTQVVKALLIIFLAFIFALILTKPVSWLESKKIKRVWACLIVFGTILILAALMAWLVFPVVYRQLQTLITNLPEYIDRITLRISGWVTEYPQISNDVKKEGSDISNLLPPTSEMITTIGNYSFSIVTMFFIFILFSCMVAYLVSRPEPVIRSYFLLFPVDKRDKAERALIHTKTMLLGWMKANLIGGSIKAVVTTAFLTAMGVPGAFVWGALVLFADMIPNIGFYIMSIPPTLVALSISPYTAVWVFVFFVLLSETMSSFVMPRILSVNLKIHPVSTLVVLLIMGAAFGLLGAILTVPVTSIIKSYYGEFFGDQSDGDRKIEKRVEAVVEC